VNGVPSVLFLLGVSPFRTVLNKNAKIFSDTIMHGVMNQELATEGKLNLNFQGCIISCICPFRFRSGRNRGKLFMNILSSWPGVGSPIHYWK
jgi:hypothetical protein